MALFKGLFINKKTGETPDIPSNLAAVVSKTRDKDGRIELQINVATPKNPQAAGSSTAASTADILNTLTQETSVNINAIVNSYEDLFDDDEDSNTQRADSEEPDDEVTCNQKITGISGQIYTQRDVYNAQLSFALLRQTRNVLDMNHSHLKQADVRNKDVLEKYQQALLTLQGSENKAMNLIQDMKSSTQFNWVRFLKTHAKKQQQVLQPSSVRKGKTPKKTTSSSASSNKPRKNPMRDTTVPIFDNGDPDDDPSSSSDSSDSDSDDDYEDAQPRIPHRKRTPSRRSRSRDTSGKRGNDMPLIKFDGNDDVAGWIHQMELTQDDMGWSDRKLCRVALRCLDKTAAVWLQTLHKRGFTFSSWKGSDGLRKRLETRFGECTKGVGRTYQTMLQRPEETAEQFYDRASQAVALRDAGFPNICWTQLGRSWRISPTQTKCSDLRRPGKRRKERNLLQIKGNTGTRTPMPPPQTTRIGAENALTATICGKTVQNATGTRYSSNNKPVRQQAVRLPAASQNMPRIFKCRTM